jgi:two-component system response regulator FixJ
MPQTKALGKRKVHIIDDEAGLRESLALLLSTAGVETTAYDSAEAFLSSGVYSAPSCVILDNRLPGLSGLDLLQRLKELRSKSNVIMMTGHADIPTAVAAMKFGAFHFIEKPIDGELLLAAVEEALAGIDKFGAEGSEQDGFAARLQTLTQRETEVYQLLIEGLPTKSIAARLDITGRTTEHHRAAVMRKLDARSISHLMRLALNHGRS